MSLAEILLLEVVLETLHLLHRLDVVTTELREGIPAGILEVGDEIDPDGSNVENPSDLQSTSHGQLKGVNNN